MGNAIDWVQSAKAEKPSPEVWYDDAFGMWVCGGRMFRTKKDAKEYAKQLLAA